MKTAVQELIDWVEEIENSPASLTFEEKYFRLLKQFKEKFISKLEAEKKQIEDAFNEGKGTIFSSSYTAFWKGEDYYNEKFKTK